MKHSISYHTVPRETFEAADQIIENYRTLLEAYLEQLLWWNQRVNLVSRNVSRETIWEHIRHSLLIHNSVPFSKASTIVDAGTGGGLPGIPLAITHPDKEFLLNDIVTKKVVAVRQMILKLDLQNVTAVDRSVEEVPVSDPFLLISKHAFKIDQLFTMTYHLPWTETVFFKGLDFGKELTEISTPLSVVVNDLSEGSSNSFYENKAIVVISRLGKLE